MNIKQKITTTIIVLAVIAFLLWHPRTRSVMIWLLPLGKNWDDLAVIILLVAILLLAFVRGWISIPSLWRHDKNE